MAIRLSTSLIALFAAVTLIVAGPARGDHHEGAHEVVEDAPAVPAVKNVVLYESGVHYEELLVPVPNSDPNKIEVVEMFSYLCIHCFNFDAAVHEWAKRQDDGVVFTRVPAIFSKPWQLYAQAFYTAEALGVSDKTHDAIFESVHTFKQNLQTPEALAGLFKKAAGVEEEAFMKAFNSFSVRSKVQQADSRGRQVRLSSVPTLIVNGKYKTNSSLAGTNVGMLQVVDFLIKKEQAAAAEAETAEVTSTVE